MTGDPAAAAEIRQTTRQGRKAPTTRCRLCPAYCSASETPIRRNNRLHLRVAHVAAWSSTNESVRKPVAERSGMRSAATSTSVGSVYSCGSSTVLTLCGGSRLASDTLATRLCMMTTLPGTDTLNSTSKPPPTSRTPPSQNPRSASTSSVYAAASPVTSPPAPATPRSTPKTETGPEDCVMVLALTAKVSGMTGPSGPTVAPMPKASTIMMRG
mmetsp:Transcript_14606/g.29263  ORF Transcript_14606/g.29263 Transcript_14606/m.29263 type:complete len:213 (+) Transcript_14606:823-1461(+)